MHTVFALLCFVVVIHWLNFPYPSGLLHWHCGNLAIAPVPAKQPWWIWINTTCEFIMNDCITTTKQRTTKPCAYFLGYTVNLHRYSYLIMWLSWDLGHISQTVSELMSQIWRKYAVQIVLLLMILSGSHFAHVTITVMIWRIQHGDLMGNHFSSNNKSQVKTIRDFTQCILWAHKPIVRYVPGPIIRHPWGPTFSFHYLINLIYSATIKCNITMATEDFATRTWYLGTSIHLGAKYRTGQMRLSVGPGYDRNVDLSSLSVIPLISLVW